ncbi:hypothetical protein [Terrabacter carboxydivorans]
MTRSDRRSKAVEVVGSAAGAGVGAILGGPVGGIIGAAITPGTIELVGRAWDEIVGAQRANGAAVVQIAAEQASSDPETLVAELIRDPAAASLFKSAVQAGANAVEEDKIRALATCLANGFADGTRVNSELIIIKALAELDPVHVRVLAMLEKVRTAGASAYRVHEFLVGPEATPRQFLTSDDLSGPVLAVLERQALVAKMDEEDRVAARARTGQRDPVLRKRDESIYRITAFGRLCLERLGHIQIKRLLSDSPD